MTTRACQFCGREVPIRLDLQPSRQFFGHKMHEQTCPKNPDRREPYHRIGPTALVEISYCVVRTRAEVTEQYKYCHGRYHAPAELLPITSFYKLKRQSASKTAYYMARCKKCCNAHNYSRGPVPLVTTRGVLLSQYHWIFLALHSRIRNYATLGKLLGTTRSHAQRLVLGEQKRVGRPLMERAIKLLHELQHERRAA